jgi:hypothetical protein
MNTIKFTASFVSEPRHSYRPAWNIYMRPSGHKLMKALNVVVTYYSCHHKAAVLVKLTSAFGKFLSNPEAYCMIVFIDHIIKYSLSETGLCSLLFRE